MRSISPLTIDHPVYNWAVGWTIEVLGLDSRWGLGFFFSTASRRALRSTSLLSNRYKGVFPWGKGAGAWSWPSTSI